MNLKDIKKYLSLKKDKFDNSIFVELKLLKNQAKEDLIEEMANEIWCFETISNIQKMYLTVFSKLKENKYDNYFKAWELLERIDIELSSLKSNFDYSRNDFGLVFIESMIKEYEKLFPYEYFTSRETIVKKMRCSICGHVNTLRRHCEHKPGQLYMGEMCCQIIEDAEFIGIAIVKNPLEKYTVLFPQGMEYNYFMLENLMPKLNTPYDRWYVDIIKESNPIYKNIGRNDKCPCGSDKKYKKCCLGTEKEYTNHHRVTLLDNPDIEPIPFQLGSTWKNR